MNQRKTKSGSRELIETVVIAVGLALLMRLFVVQAFKIPSGSMETTLLVGDHILVNKFLYGIHRVRLSDIPLLGGFASTEWGCKGSGRLVDFRAPQRGDIVVFEYPWEQDRDFIKRVIARPGERVQVRDRQVLVDGQSLTEPYARWQPHGREENFGPVLVPKKGDVVEVRPDQRLYVNNEAVSIPTAPSGKFHPRDLGDGMEGFEVFYGALFPAGTTLQKPAGPYTVETDYYFALGDNRDNSKDSRYWGFVNSNCIKGKAFFIYWSWNRDGSFEKHVRWDRLGKLLHAP